MYEIFSARRLEHILGWGWKGSLDIIYVVS